MFASALFGCYYNFVGGYGNMSPILKIKGHNEAKERDFELNYQLSLTPEQRISIMLELSKQILIMARKYATRKTYRIIQRP